MKKALENKKRFEKPVLEIVEFTSDDIITQSFGSPDGNSEDVLSNLW